MKNQPGLLFILAISIFFFSCEKAEDLLPPQKFKSKDFPISLGTYWDYRWMDLDRNIQDTLRATIIAEGITKAGKSDLWMLEWKPKHETIRVRIDTQYIEYTEEFIAFYDYSRFDDSLILESQYNFPFQIEDEWTIDHNQGTYRVLNDRHELSAYNVPEGHGKGLYLQRRAFGDNNFSIYDNIVMAKGIGVAWRNFNVTKGVPFDVELFQLIDYEVK